MKSSATIMLLLFSLYPFLLLGKELKKIIRQSTIPGFVETYYILKSDTSVRQGIYKLEALGKLVVEGNFKAGMRDSTWIQYNLNGIVRTRGGFTMGKRTGIWDFFNDLGQLEQKVDFSTGEVLFYQTIFAKHPFRVISGKDSMITVLDRPPLYLGGTSRLNDDISSEIMLPLHKSGEKVEGTVFVRFTIDSLGKTFDHHLLRGIGNACNEEAMRVIKIIPYEWLPGILNGKPVNVEYILPIIFDKNTKSPELF